MKKIFFLAVAILFCGAALSLPVMFSGVDSVSFAIVQAEGPGNGGGGTGDAGGGAGDAGGAGGDSGGPGNGGGGTGDIGGGCCGDGGGDPGPGIDPDPGVDPEPPVDPPVDPTPTPICTLSVDDNSILVGDTVVLTLSAQNADTAVIDQGIDAVAIDATVNRTLNTAGTVTFTATVSDSNGNDADCSVSVTVEDDNNPPPPDVVVCTAFTANPTSLPRGGGTVTLNWTVSDAVSVEINNGVGQFINGETSTQVNVTSDTTFRLTATDSNGNVDSTSCAASVDVDTGGGGGGGTPLRCELEASITSINAGDEVILTWDNRRADEIAIFENDEDEPSNEIFRTDDEDGSDNVDDGSITVRPTEDTEYILVTERRGRERLCRVDITVDESDVVVLQDRSQEPRVAGIALSQVPNTGFEAGPTLTLIFYTLLALWGMFVAYTFIAKDKTAAAGVSSTDDEILKKKLQMLSQRNQNLNHW